MKIIRYLLVPIILFLSACAGSLPSPTLSLATQPVQSNDSLPTIRPTLESPSPTPNPSPTLTPTQESLPLLQVITKDNVDKLSLLRTLPIPGFKNSSVSQCTVGFSPDGALLAGVCNYSTVPVWDVLSGELKYSLLPEASHEVGIAFNPTGEVLAVGGFSGEIHLFDIATGQTLPVSASFPSQVWDIAFSPAGDQLAASTFSTGAFLVSYPGGMPIWNSGESSHESVLSLAFSPDGSQVAFGRLSKGVMILSAQDGTIITEMHIPAPVGDVTYSPNGQWLAAGSDDNKIRLWDTVGYSQTLTLVGHAGYVNGVAFNPDGSLLISGSHDHKVGVWDVSTGKLLRFLEGHENTVLRLSINPSGTLIASISWDGTVRLWGVKTE